MKINKKKLKEIILEELNNMEEITSAAASSGEDGPISKSDLIKQQRATKGADLARSASGLSGQVAGVNVQALLNQISKALEAPGNQASANVVRLLQQALKQASQGAKE